MGKGYWNAMRELMYGLECALGAIAVRELLPDSNGRDWPDGLDREAFYVRCWEFVKARDWSDLEPEASEKLQRHVAVAKRAVRAIRRPFPVPEVLHVSPRAKLLVDDGDDVLVYVHNPNDPCRIPTRLWKFLHLVEGRTVDEAREQLAPIGIPFDDPTVARMLEWGVLVG
jgi:hypothetical protein